MKSLGKRLLAGATTEVKVPLTIEFDVSIYSVATKQPQQEVLDLLKARFVSANRPGSYEPRIVNISGKAQKALALFAGLSKPDLVSAERFSASDGAQVTVTATRSWTYTSSKTTETAMDGSTRVLHEEAGEMKFGVSLNLRAVAVVKRDEVEVICYRSTSRPRDVATGLLRPVIVHTSSAAKGLLARHDAMVHVEFLPAEQPTGRFSGEAIITVILAKTVSPTRD
ncbi:hypothetical protein [Rhizobium sp. BK176]|uniref:hypothetical protein n=1 Tax=Rhizobium sp. BK176 TaxID=2587071 RepID=UPI0021685091|nr:hypothetical protein [Rhizobium sp. BK176]MCS4090035.1 hypothetical protein [Rhizobium sp. BK176]